MIRAGGSRYWVLFALFWLTALLSLRFWIQAPPPEKHADLGALLSRTMSPWEGRDVTLTPGTRTLLGAGNVLLREYRRAGRPPVLLCLTYSAGSHLVTHAPEVCYEGQGWTVTSKAEAVLHLQGPSPGRLTVERFRVTGPGKSLMVVVWYRTASGETSSYLRQKLSMLFGRFFGGVRWSSMIRLSVPAGSGTAGEEEAWKEIEAFCAVLVPRLSVLFQELEP